METLKKSINFISKNPLILLPAFVAVLIPSLMTFNAIDPAFIQAYVTEIIEVMSSGGSPARLEGMLNDFTTTVMAGTALASTVGIVLNLIATPLLFTLAFKDKVDMEDLTANLTKNIVKFILFCLSILVLCIIAGLALSIAIVIVAFTQISALIFVAAVTAFVAVIIFMIKLSFWFPIYISKQDAGIVSSAKESLELTSGLAGQIFLINLLISLVALVASMIFTFLSTVPVIYPVITSLIMALSSTISTVYLVKLYLEEKPSGINISEATAEPALD